MSSNFGKYIWTFVQRYIFPVRPNGHIIRKMKYEWNSTNEVSIIESDFFFQEDILKKKIKNKNLIIKVEKPN